MSTQPPGVLDPRPTAPSPAPASGHAPARAPAPGAPGAARVHLAIIANAPSPYRIAQHTRIVRELPEVRLTSIFLHEHNWQPWSGGVPDEINPIIIARGRAMSGKNRPRHWPKTWANASRVLAWLRREKPDAVIITGYNDIGLARLIRWLHAARVPTFMFSDSNVHGDHATGLARVVKGAYVRWVVRHLTGLMPCGRFGVEYYQRYGGDPARMFYMPHEPDYDSILRVDPAHVRAVAERFGLRPDRRRIIYTGRLAPVKRVDLLIDAFARLADERPEWDLLVVGGGPLEHELKARVPERLRGRVTWAGFIDGRADLAALYTNAEVHVLPSDYEPWAVVVAEGAAAGCALVCSSVVGAGAELVRDGVNGRLFEKGSVDSLTDALRDVTDPARTAQLRAASRDVLADWRRRGDPVDGVRKALRFAGLWPGPAGGTP